MTNYMPKFNASLSKEQINNIFENLKIHNLYIFLGKDHTQCLQIVIAMCREEDHITITRNVPKVER